MQRTPEQAYAELIRRTKETALLGSCGGVLGWDERTYLPKQGGSLRAEQLALLARMTHELATDPVIGELLGEIEGTPLVADPASDAGANVREIRRSYDRAVKLPKALVEELARAATLGQRAWQEAREKSEFALFRPHLEKIVGLKRQEAAALGYEKTPYDALLDEYEPGATSEAIARTFAELRTDLVPVIQAVLSSSAKAPTEILKREYPVERQKEFGRSAAQAIGFDFDSGRLDVTTHPFCSGMGPGDCRITTRYNPRHFNESFFGILHEAGHGLYEQGLDAEHFGTPRGQACSLGIHESQSRMWENLVGRSRPFWEHFFPKARQVFPEALGNETLDRFYFAINDVRASFIRVEADEATYNLHVILRFELERDLIAGDLKPADMPGAWNERFQKSFSLTPANDAQGCLQDIHWSAGLIGYFPTYTLGNLCASQLMEQARHDLGDQTGEAFRRGEFAPLRKWLNDKIHRQGQRYRAPELVKQVTGKPLGHEPLMRHLRGKLGPLYGI